MMKSLALLLLTLAQQTAGDCTLLDEQMYRFNLSALPRDISLGANYTAAASSEKDFSITMTGVGPGLYSYGARGIGLAGCSSQSPSNQPTTPPVTEAMIPPTSQPTHRPSTLPSTDNPTLSSSSPTVEPNPSPNGTRHYKRRLSDRNSSSSYAYISVDTTTLRDSCYSCCATQRGIRLQLRVASSALETQSNFNVTLYREQNFSGDPLANGLPVASCRSPFSHCLLQMLIGTALMDPYYAIVLVDEKTGLPGSACIDLAVSELMTSSRICSTRQPSADPSPSPSLHPSEAPSAVAIISINDSGAHVDERSNGEVALLVMAIGSVAIVACIFVAFLRRYHTQKDAEAQSLLESGSNMTPCGSGKSVSSRDSGFLTSSETRYAPVPPKNPAAL